MSEDEYHAACLKALAPLIQIEREHYENLPWWRLHLAQTIDHIVWLLMVLSTNLKKRADLKAKLDAKVRWNSWAQDMKQRSSFAEVASPK